MLLGVTMSNLIVSNDIYEVTQRHKNVYFNINININFSNVFFNHYHNNSFKDNNNNSNNNLLCLHLTLIWSQHDWPPAQHRTGQVEESLTWAGVKKNEVNHNERNVIKVKVPLQLSKARKVLWRKKNILLFQKS